MGINNNLKIEVQTNNMLSQHHHREMSQTTGYLELILGSMFSGKTSKLIEIYRQYTFCNIPVLVINHEFDDRYENASHAMSSHDSIQVPCVKTSSLKKLLNDHNMAGTEVFLINEGQFFEDLVEAVKDLLVLKKKVYVCGLDGDFERKKFGHILDLIPLCDSVTKLKSLCAVCKNGTPGIFSKRLTCQTQQTVIGTTNYIPVCRNCY